MKFEEQIKFAAKINYLKKKDMDFSEIIADFIEKMEKSRLTNIEEIIYNSQNNNLLPGRTKEAVLEDFTKYNNNVMTFGIDMISNMFHFGYNKMCEEAELYNNPDMLFGEVNCFM